MKIIQDHFKIYYFIYFGLSFYQLEVIELFNWKIHPNTIHSLFSRIQRKMIKMLKFKGKQRKREGLLFPSDQRFAYLHYPFPGTISITTSHSDSGALTQTRIATRGVPLGNVSTLEQRNVYRCAFSFSPGLFTSGILFFSFSFFFSPPSLFFPRVVVVDKRACTGDRSRIESISSPLQHPQSPLGHVVNPGWRWYVHRCANTIRARRRCIRCTNPRTTGFIDSQGVNSGAFISVRPIERPGWKETSTRPRIRVHYIN